MGKEPNVTFPSQNPSYLRSFFVSALIGIVFASLFTGSVYVFAVPPTSQYSPGETLNPNCAVGATNCSVIAPVPYTGATAALDLGAKNLTTTGTVTVGSVSNNLSAFAATTSAQLAGVISDETGSGALVFGTSPTFTGTVTIPTPFTLGASSVTSTGTQLNYLNASTGTTGTTSTNIVFSTSPTLVTPALGTPSAVVLTNATGLPISTGVSGLGTGIATWLATPSSSNLISAVTDESGTGSLIFGTSPTLTTPVIGAATGTSVALTNASGAQATFKYDASNYASFTTASSGDLTIATTSGNNGGDITLDTATTGDATIFTTNGNLVLSGSGGTNNESLKFDFETTANEAAVSSTTGATNIDFGSLNLETTGTLTLGGSTAGTLVTRVKAGAATESDANGAMVVDSSNGRLYFRYGSAWHYVAQTAGFQIPDFETIDPISGEQMKEGDIVLGMINQTFEDKALHGVWVTWDGVKAQLLKDLKEKGIDRLIAEGEQKNNPDPETFLDKVKNGLFSLGISAKNGLTTIKELAADRLTAKVARIEQLEMVDRDTGEVYCTWVGQGEWQKAKGECGSVQVAVVDKQLEQQANEAVQQAANQAAIQAGQQVVEQVQEQIQEEIKEEVKEQVEEQVQEEVKEQLQQQEEIAVEESEPVEIMPAPASELEPILEPQPEAIVEPEPESELAPAVIDIVIQEVTASLVGAAGNAARSIYNLTIDSAKYSAIIVLGKTKALAAGIFEVSENLDKLMAGRGFQTLMALNQASETVHNRVSAVALQTSFLLGEATLHGLLYIEGGAQKSIAGVINPAKNIWDFIMIK